MRRERMFNQRLPWTTSDDPNPVISECSAKSRNRTLKKLKNFHKISSRLSIALQETKNTLKLDVQKYVPRHRFVPGEAFWTELKLHFNQREPPASTDLSHVPGFILDEDLDSGCEDESNEPFEQEQLKLFLAEKTHKFGWFEHVELYLERADQIPKVDPEHDATNCSKNLSEKSAVIATPKMEQFFSIESLPARASQSLPEDTSSAMDLSLNFSVSSMEVDSVAEKVHELIENLSDEMFSPAASPPVIVPAKVPSDAGYSTGQSGQDAARNEAVLQHSTLQKSSSMASGEEAPERDQSTTDNSSSAAAAATPLHASRPAPRIRSVLKKRLSVGDPPSTVKKTVTFSKTGTVLNPYEERDRRVFRETRKMHNDSNVLENTLPQQQSTPKPNHVKTRGAKRKCVYDFEEDSTTEESNSGVAEVSTQTDSFEEMIQEVINRTIKSMLAEQSKSEEPKSEESKSDEDSKERYIQMILQAEEASFNVKPKPKKRKRRKLDRINSSLEMLIKKVDKLEKRHRSQRIKKTRRLIVKKVVPAKPKPSTDRSSQTEAPSTSEASVATTFELSKPAPKPRAPRKRAAPKAKQEDPEPEGETKKKRNRKGKKDQNQQTIVQCLKPEQVLVEPDIGRMEDGQLVAEDCEDNLSQPFEIEESIPPMSAPASPVLRDPRLIKGTHRKPPSIIETQPNSPAPSLPESSSSQGTVTNRADNADVEVESFNRQIIRLRIDSDSQPVAPSSVKKSQQKSRRQKPLKPYPANPKIRSPSPKLVARRIVQPIYRYSQDYSPVQPIPIDPWKDPIMYPWETCEYLQKHLLQLIKAGKLPGMIETYGEPCWYICADQSSFDLNGDGIYDVPEPEYPQFSQEFSPIAPAEGFDHIVHDDDEKGYLSDSGSVVADES